MENGINTIAVFGDSILKGIVTGTESGQMYDIAKGDSLTLASQALGFELLNFSAFGNIVTKGQRTLERQLSRGLQADAVIIESGGNDCDRDWIAMSKDPGASRDNRVPYSDFIRILDQMVQTVRSHKMTPILTTMPPLVYDRWFNTLCINANPDVILDVLGHDKMNLYRIHEYYSLGILHYAHTHDVQLVDLRRELLTLPDYPEYMCLDGIHPNEKGYAFIASIWQKELPLLKKEF